MNNKVMTIKDISLLSSVITVFSLIAFVLIFSRNYAQSQRDFTQSEFKRIALSEAESLDREIEQAEQSLFRLKGYVSILKEDNGITKEKLTFLKKLMADNIQFQENAYNIFFSLNAEKAQQYFNSKGYVLTVHKNPQQKGTVEYGKPENSIAEVWPDPQYLTNKNETWYHIGKTSKDPQITPIYFDTNYMKTWMFSIVMRWDEGNEFQGVIGADILLDTMFESIEKINLGKTGGALLIDNQSGLVLTQINNVENKDEALLKIDKRLNYNVYNNKASQQQWQPIISKNVSHIDIYGANNQVYTIASKKLNKLPWTLVVYQQKKELQEKLYKNIFTLIIVGAIALIFLIFTSYLFTKEIVNPIRNLVKTMYKVKTHVGSEITVPVSGTLETRELGTIFNEMLVSINNAVKAKDEYGKKLTELNAELENIVTERTKELRTQAQRLEQTLQELRQTQTQLIQNEKMSSLGQLVAGVAHEINNPVNFIYGNLSHAKDYTEGILSLLELYQHHYPQPVTEIVSEAEEIDIDFISKDLPKILASMKIGAERIREIVLTLRNFSRLDEAEMKEVDIHEGIDSTLLILQNRLKASSGNSGIQIVKHYANLPKVECYAGQLNQVLMNLINNAIDAVDEYNKQQTPEANTANPSVIKISTEMLNAEAVKISIADNGPGIPDNIKQFLFNPFFTTKPVGQGTGLGLAISYQIVVEKHSGLLRCESISGQGAEFIIELPIRQNIKKVKVE